MLKQRAGLVCGFRMPEKESLIPVTMDVLYEGELGWSLNAFSDNLEIEAFRHSNNGCGNGRTAPRRCDATDERAVNLQCIER